LSPCLHEEGYRKNTAGMLYLLYRSIVQSSSAWAGLAGGSPVDEVEAVRIISGEPPGVITSLKSKRTNPVGNDRTKTLAVIEKHSVL